MTRNNLIQVQLFQCKVQFYWQQGKKATGDFPVNGMNAPSCELPDSLGQEQRANKYNKQQSTTALAFNFDVFCGCEFIFDNRVTCYYTCSNCMVKYKLIFLFFLFYFFFLISSMQFMNVECSMLMLHWWLVCHLSSSSLWSFLCFTRIHNSLSHSILFGLLSFTLSFVSLCSWLCVSPETNEYPTVASLTERSCKNSFQLLSSPVSLRLSDVKKERPYQLIHLACLWLDLSLFLSFSLFILSFSSSPSCFNGKIKTSSKVPSQEQVIDLHYL